jgi:hypothetical protein
MPICHHGGPVSILDNSVWEICGGQSGTGKRFYSEYFGFPASLSRTILIFIYMSLCEAWYPSKQHCSCGHQGPKDRQFYSCNKTNLIHYLSSVYSVTMPVHVTRIHRDARSTKHKIVVLLFISAFEGFRNHSVLIVRNLCGVRVDVQVTDNLSRQLWSN